MTALEQLRVVVKSQSGLGLHVVPTIRQQADGQHYVKMYINQQDDAMWNQHPIPLGNAFAQVSDTSIDMCAERLLKKILGSPYGFAVNEYSDTCGKLARDEERNFPATVEEAQMLLAIKGQK